MKNSFNKLDRDAVSVRKKFGAQTRVPRTKMRNRDHIFTLGIEEEFQIVDPKTRELRSHIEQILAYEKMLLKEHVKAEMHQSMVELGTEICADTAAARQRSRGKTQGACSGARLRARTPAARAPIRASARSAAPCVPARRVPGSRIAAPARS